MTRLGGWAAVAAGLLGVLVLAGRWFSIRLEGHPPGWLYYEYVSRLSLLPPLLGAVAVHALYRLRPNGAARMRYALAACGLGLTAVANAVMFGWRLYDLWMLLLYVAGYTLSAVGLLAHGAAAARTGLPLLLRIGPAAIGVLMLAGQGTTVAWLLGAPGQLPLVGILLSGSVAVAAGGSPTPGLIIVIATGAAWVVLGLGLLRAAVPADDRPEAARRPLAELVRAFGSRATLVSGTLGVVVWGLQLGWTVGLLVVLLLYAHELGHVLFALWRGVPVRGAPVFLPGFGAFVRLGSHDDVWDDVWTSLGGPIVGSIAAVGTRVVGDALGWSALSAAGDFALLINVLNLAPLGPLDGGRVAARLGWVGSLLSLPVAAVALAAGLGPIATLIALVGIWGAFRSARAGVPWADRGPILVVYLALLATLAATWLASATGRRSRVTFPDWAPDLETLFVVGIALLFVSSFAVQRIWRWPIGARARYLLLALLGWPSYLLGRVWQIPVTWLLAAQALGLPGLRWLERLLGYLAAERKPAAGFGAACGYDLLWQTDPPAADAWLARLRPDLRKGGPLVLAWTYADLCELGYASAANGWVADAMREHPDIELPPGAANAFAWSKLMHGEPEGALVAARMAVEGEPSNYAYLDTLGQVELAVGHFEAAQEHLRRSLELRERSATRVALARALARQGHPAAAAAEAERALAERVGHWGDDEPKESQVRAWIEEWRATA